MAELSETIKESAGGPKRVTSDGVSVEQHSLAEQIEADKYFESKKATRKKGLGIKISKGVPPGTI